MQDTNRARVHFIVYTGLLTAIVALATMVISLPTPLGYFNIGDSMVFMGGLILGPLGGFITGGLGSSMADILLGYTIWAPWTFVIKGIQGAVVGLIAHASYRKQPTPWSLRFLIATLSGTAVMVFGYWLAAGIMAGNLGVGIATVPSDIVQGLVSIVISFPLALLLRKALFTNRQS